MGLKIGFYTHDPEGAGVFGGIAKVAKSVLMNIVENTVHIRAYRKPAKPSKDVLWKVDEYRNVDQPSMKKLRGSRFSDHHIKHDIPTDMMKRNNLNIEVVPDGRGGLQPNIQHNGMVKAYINFPDANEETLRRAEERVKIRKTL